MSAFLQMSIIFLFVIALFFISAKIIDLIWIQKARLTPNYMKGIFAIFSFIFWFAFSLIATLLFSIFLVRFPLMKTEAAKIPQPRNIAINTEDCQKIIDTIYLTENQIYQVENHRYIEEVSPIFTINIEYEKGAKMLRSAAEKYQNLEIAANTKYYSDQIAQSLHNKASLFQERINSQGQKKSIKELVRILEKMDRVTQQRQMLIDRVEKQCDF